jgi:hypothetical protein
MDTEALAGLFLIIGFIIFVIGLFAVLGAPIVTLHDPDRRHDLYGPDGRRPPNAW